MLLSFLSFSLVALYSVTVYASPLWHRDSTGVSDAQLSQFLLFSQYSAAAYCFGNVHGSVGTSVSCSAGGGSCPNVESAQTSILQSFVTTGGTTTEGYVVRDNTNKLLVIAFQGSQFDESPIDILTNADLIQRDTNLCGSANTRDGCQVHSGFYRSMNDANAQIASTITTAIAAHPDYKLVTTGHSLGGAIAALLGTQLRNQGHIVDIYTYGQPRLGAADISLHIQSQSPSLGSNNRITHTNDIVPQLPPRDFDYTHYFNEYWIMNDDLPVGKEDIKIVEGSLFSANGNEGEVSGLGLVIDLVLGVEAHGGYFANDIAACDSGPP